MISKALAAVGKGSNGLAMAVALAIGLAVAMQAPGAHAANAAFCEKYASFAVSQSDKCINARKKCDCRGKTWSQDYTVHYNWCRNNEAARARQIQALRAKYLWKACDMPTLPPRTAGVRARWYSPDQFRFPGGTRCPNAQPHREGEYCYARCRPGFATAKARNKRICVLCPSQYPRGHVLPNGMAICTK